MESLALSEGASGSYRVKLHTDPGGTVTVTPQSGDSTRLTVPGALSFTGGSGGTWSQWQGIMVESLPDADLANDDITVTHDVSNYGSIATGPEVAVSIVDRGVGVTVNPTMLSVGEGAGGSYDIRLHSRPRRTSPSPRPLAIR